MPQKIYNCISHAFSCCFPSSRDSKNAITPFVRINPQLNSEQQNSDDSIYFFNNGCLNSQIATEYNSDSSARLVTDSRGCILFISSAAFRLLELTEDDIGKSVSNLFTSNPENHDRLIEKVTAESSVLFPSSSYVESYVMSRNSTNIPRIFSIPKQRGGGIISVTIKLAIRRNMNEETIYYVIVIDDRTNEILRQKKMKQ